MQHVNLIGALQGKFADVIKAKGISEIFIGEEEIEVTSQLPVDDVIKNEIRWEILSNGNVYLGILSHT